MADEFTRNGLPHLRGQFAQARPILLTGAGFSTRARNLAGDPLPMASQLTQRLWELCFPGSPLEDDTDLQDVFQEAVLRRRADLMPMLTRLLTVDASSLTIDQKSLFDLPWFKIYTLNIDDLDSALSRTYRLRRPIDIISATSGIQSVSDLVSARLPVIHLNGTLSDVPDRVTFSQTQYADRLAQPDPWYSRLAAEIATHPIVFVGTRLDEPPLWQHVEMRRYRGLRHLRREFRPRSYLVTPSLNKARQALLDEYHVMWVPMNAEQFAEALQAGIGSAADDGHAYIGRMASFSHRRSVFEVASLAKNPTARSDFLMGAQPIWADLQSGRAIERTCDAAIIAAARTILLAKDGGSLVLIDGTAGSGKSVALMRLALALVADGTRVAWIDLDNSASPNDIREAMRASSPPAALCIDDADAYGFELASLVADCLGAPNHPLVAVGMRSARAAQILPAGRLPGVRVLEFSVPLLADDDIDRLLEILTREGLLGVMRAMSRAEQKAVFRSKADRQLLVAMIEATSGQRFDAKIAEEFDDLDADSQFVYACVAVASHFGVSLSRQDLLVASGDRSNLALERLDQLAKSHILLPASHGTDLFRARHRVIADHLTSELQHRGVLADTLQALIVIAATKVNPEMRRSEAPWRFVRALINHDFLIGAVGDQGARDVYDAVAGLLEWDHHYWLQRGSLEVQSGRLDVAENMLNQSRMLAPENPQVRNEWAYLLFRKALLQPSHADSASMVYEAQNTLRELMATSPERVAHSFHVYGQQGLKWIQIGGVARSQQRDAFDDLVQTVRRGLLFHPQDNRLIALLRELNRSRITLGTSK